MKININPKIFKAYDIRGIYGKDWDEEGAYKIGRAYAELLKSDNYDKEKLVIAVGQDMRLSSPSLAKKIIEGVTDSGADVVDIGLVSTPTFYFAVAKGGYDGGLQISASHNPKEYNGVKVVKKKAYPVSLEDGLDKLRDMVQRDEFEEVDVKGKTTNLDGFVAEAAKYSLGYYDFSGIKPFKIVADVANAMGALDLEELFKNLPCELIKMNFKLDGTFPAHQADPFQQENNRDLEKRVSKEGADLGIAVDGDGDRIFFIDDQGKFIDPSIIRGILAKVVLRNEKGANIGYDIRPGRITRDMILESGGKPFISKVGHSLIKKQGIEENSPFSGESSGHFFFRTDFGFFEMPMIVVLIILKEISDGGIPISKMIEPLKKYHHSGEINSEVEDKEAMMKKIEELYTGGAKDISLLDGVTIEYEDFWFNVRASNTEPLLRLNLEAKTKDLMQEKTEELLRVIRS